MHSAEADASLPLVLTFRGRKFWRVSFIAKRLDAPYRSGPSKAWLKSKNPLSEAVRREAEEDWRKALATLSRRVWRSGGPARPMAPKVIGDAI